MANLVIRPITTIDASDLGLKPGEWPEQIKFEGWTWLGPTKFWNRDNGNLLHVSYHCNGRKLVVVND